MDLICESKVQTNTMISSHYIAFGVAGLLFFSMPDSLGRKTSMVLNLSIHLAAQYMILFVPLYWARFLGLVLFGFAQLKNTVCYIWMAELVPKNYSDSVSVTLTSFDSFTIAVVCLYFLLVSRDWFPLMMTMTALCTLALLFAAWYMPESPTWLLSKGRVSEAIDSFNQIGRINGAKKLIPANATFVEAPTAISVHEASEQFVSAVERSTFEDYSRLVFQNHSIQQVG